MNILFLSPGQTPDYQCDMLFFGLNELSEATVYTNVDLWYMFKGNDEKRIFSLYGKGFSLYNRLNAKKNIEDPAIILERIKTKFYDKIIYGSIKRCSLFLNEVLHAYSRDQIAFIDGEDSDFSLLSNLKNYKQITSIYKDYRKAIDLSKKGIYFKRELRDCDRKYFYPISFAIPEINIIKDPLKQRAREQAFIIPGDIDTYIYDQESDYYEGYAISKYALTIKKGGWDCLRHYEILANGCIPYFTNIEKCPNSTMHLFPKHILVETNKLIETNNLGDSVFEFYSSILYSYTKNYLTTRMLAKYVLSILK